MTWVVNERIPRSRWRDVFGVHSLTTDRHQTSQRATNGRVVDERFWREWFSQRTWEDDGGRVGQDLTRITD